MPLDNFVLNVPSICLDNKGKEHALELIDEHLSADCLEELEDGVLCVIEAVVGNVPEQSLHSAELSLAVDVGEARVLGRDVGSVGLCHSNIIKCNMNLEADFTGSDGDVTTRRDRTVWGSGVHQARKRSFRREYDFSGQGA